MKIVYGPKGTGKTKVVIADANALVESAKGHVVFITDTNRYMYDLKYQIRRIRNSQGEVDRAALQEIENEIGIYDSVTRTGIPALDVILTEKSLICEKADISLTCMIEGEKLLFGDCERIIFFLSLGKKVVSPGKHLPDRAYIARDMFNTVQDHAFFV